MARMSCNNKCPGGNFGDSSQLTKYILDYGSIFHMKQEVLDFIPGSLGDTDKHIEVADGHHVTARKKRQAQIKMCNNNRDPFVATLHYVLLAPYLCDILFYIITLMNSRHTCLFHKGFCTVYFGAKEKNEVKLPHGAQREHAFWGEIKEMS